MIEDGHYPIQIDNGFDPDEISKEWLEQVINSTVHPRISGLAVRQISLSSNGARRVIYAISIPAATSHAPHQAKDKKYYRRYNFESVPMEDYEVRDALRRATSPRLWIKFQFQDGQEHAVQFDQASESSDVIKLLASIGNESQEPALYWVVRFFIDTRFIVKTISPGFLPIGETIFSNGREMQGFHKISACQDTCLFFNNGIFLYQNSLLNYLWID